jgi:hypothetical protein
MDSNTPKITVQTIADEKSKERAQEFLDGDREF